MGAKQSDETKLILALHRARAEKDSAEAHYKECADAVIGMLDSQELKSHTIQHKDLILTGTKVESSTLNFDEPSLQEELGDHKWRTVSKRVLDRKLLEDAIAKDRISPSMVARHSEEVPRRPYVKLTVKANKED